MSNLSIRTNLLQSENHNTPNKSKFASDFLASAKKVESTNLLNTSNSKTNNKFNSALALSYPTKKGSEQNTTDQFTAKKESNITDTKSKVSMFNSKQPETLKKGGANFAVALQQGIEQKNHEETNEEINDARIQKI